MLVSTCLRRWYSLHRRQFAWPQRPRSGRWHLRAWVSNAWRFCAVVSRGGHCGRHSRRGIRVSQTTSGTTHSTRSSRPRGRASQSVGNGFDAGAVHCAAVGCLQTMRADDQGQQAGSRPWTSPGPNSSSRPATTLDSYSESLRRFVHQSSSEVRPPRSRRGRWGHHRPERRRDRARECRPGRPRQGRLPLPRLAHLVRRPLSPPA